MFFFNSAHKHQEKLNGQSFQLNFIAKFNITLTVSVLLKKICPCIFIDMSEFPVFFGSANPIHFSQHKTFNTPWRRHPYSKLGAGGGGVHIHRRYYIIHKDRCKKYSGVFLLSVHVFRELFISINFVQNDIYEPFSYSKKTVVQSIYYYIIFSTGYINDGMCRMICSIYC